jgi:hypothetical protein
METRASLLEPAAQSLSAAAWAPGTHGEGLSVECGLRRMMAGCGVVFRAPTQAKRPAAACLSLPTTPQLQLSVPKHDRALLCILAVPSAGASPLPKRKTACILWSALLVLTTIPSAASQRRQPPTGAHVRCVISLHLATPCLCHRSPRLLPCLCAGCLGQQ